MLKRLTKNSSNNFYKCDGCLRARIHNFRLGWLGPHSDLVRMAL